MMRGNRLLLLGASLTVAGCVTGGKLQVRALQQPGSKVRFSGNLLDRGRAELAYGSVGLALEDFRKLQREQGDSSDVFSGIAACYAAMGRYDLARTNYELALAYSPNEPRLLLALAATLDRIDEGEQAAQVRAEAARLTAAPALKVFAQEAVITPVGVPHASSVTVKLAPARNLQTAPASPEIAPSRQISMPVGVANARPPIVTKSDLSAIAASLPSIAISIEPQQASPILQSAAVPMRALADLRVTIGAGPPAKPESGFRKLSPVALQAGVTSPPKGHRDAALLSAADRAPPPVPSRASSPMRVEIALSEKSFATGPRLERASVGDVLLVAMPRPGPLRNTPAPAIETQPLVRIALAMKDGPRPLANPKPGVRPMALQWLPLKYATGGQNLQLLNAARTDRLAARTRQALLDRGWRKIGIGNARQVLQHSLVLYAPGRAPLGLRIASHFRCKAVQAPVRSVVVLLGRDATARHTSGART